jgi:TetR/AcrR family transcriptional regulator, lmrAB and yxaGH operons repressor
MRYSDSYLLTIMTAFSSAPLNSPTIGLESRARLISSGIRLFQSKGYCDVSLADILAETKLPKGSFYHHFPDGKEAFACAVVDAIGGEVTQFLKTSLAAGLSGQHVMASTTQAIADWLVKTDYHQGALLGCLMNGDPPQGVSAHLITVRTEWCELLARFWPDPGDIANPATLVLATLEGGIAAARLHRDTRYLLTPMKQLSNFIPTMAFVD